MEILLRKDIYQEKQHQVCLEAGFVPYVERWGFLIIHNSHFSYVYTCRGIILWIWWIKDFENVYISFVIVYGFVVHNCTLILWLLCICDWCGFGAAATVAARIVYNVCRKCTFTIYGNSAHYSLLQWSII